MIMSANSLMLKIPTLIPPSEHSYTWEPYRWCRATPAITPAGSCNVKSLFKLCFAYVFTLHNLNIERFRTVRLFGEPNRLKDYWNPTEPNRAEPKVYSYVTVRLPTLASGYTLPETMNPTTLLSSQSLRNLQLDISTTTVKHTLKDLGL